MTRVVPITMNCVAFQKNQNKKSLLGRVFTDAARGKSDLNVTFVSGKILFLLYIIPFGCLGLLLTLLFWHTERKS